MSSYVKMFIDSRLRVCVAFISLLIIVLVFSSLLQTCVYCAEEYVYVYYGVVPARIYRYEVVGQVAGVDYRAQPWQLNTHSVRTQGLISIIGLKDNTDVNVYTLPDKALVSEATLNVMEKHYVVLPNGTRFKVVSDNPVSVLLLSGGVPDPDAFEGLTPDGFYTSTDSSYIGKEFVFLASQGLVGEPYHIFALENAEVTITREDGVEQSFRLEANSHKQLSLKAFRAYRVESTGNIMIQSGELGYSQASFFIPSATGGFVGRRFYSGSRGTWAGDPDENYGFTILAMEDAKVRIWDLEVKRLIVEVEVDGGSSVSVKPEVGVIAVESDKPIMLEYVRGGDIRTLLGWSYSASVTYMGAKPNEETMFFLPANFSNQAYIFAYEDSFVRVDDIPLTIRADEHFVVSVPGIHRMVSDKNVVVQVVSWPAFPEYQGIAGFGATVPCIQTVDVTPNVTLIPITDGGEFLTTYLTIGAAAAVAFGAAVFLAVKRRSRQSRR